MQHYVYLYSDPSRGNEPIYVGMGKGGRHLHHLKRKDMHPFVQRLQLMQRNGVNPVITKIAVELDHELACLVEQEAIDKFGRKDLGRGSLLNMTNGGDGLNNPSAETRRKIGEASRNRAPDSPETRAKKGMASKTRVYAHSAETRAKIAEKARGRTLTAEHRAKISAGISASERPPCSIETRAKISATKRARYGNTAE